MPDSTNETIVADAITEIAQAITHGAASRDANGGYVGCLTEGAMSISTSIHNLAEEHGRLATAIEQLVGVLDQQQRSDATG